MAMDFSIFAWEIPGTEKSGGLQAMGSTKSRTQSRDWTTITLLKKHKYMSYSYFFKIFFWCEPFLKFLLNVLKYCFCFMFRFSWPWSMWDLSSLTRDRTYTPCIGKPSLNHWTVRGVSTPYSYLNKNSIHVLVKQQLFCQLQLLGMLKNNEVCSMDSFLLSCCWIPVKRRKGNLENRIFELWKEYNSYFHISISWN